MRSGRGKCPQCKEIIVVDLEAPEIRCPFCGALLKKSAKTVAEVRAAEEERIKAAKAREEAIEEEKAESAAPAAAPEAENPALKEEAAFPSVMTEDERSEAEFGETALKNEALNAANEMSDEELAMMDEALPEGSELLSGEAPEAEVQTDPEETVVYSSVSMEDDAPAEEENPSDEAAEEEENADLSANAEVTLEDDGSSFDEALPSDLIEDEAPAEESAEEGAKENAGSEADVSDADAALFDDEAPAFLTESETSEETAPAEEAVSPEVSPAEDSAREETPAEEIASTEEIPAEDAVSPEEIKVPAPAEDAPLEERAEEGALPAEEEVPEGVAAEENASEENALEIASPEEFFGEEAPVSEEESAEGAAEQAESGESAIEVESAESADANEEGETAADSGASESEGAKEAEEAPQYTAEDMAFAASLSDVRRKQYVAPTSKGAQKAIKAERPAKKKAAQAGGKNSMGIYKKPIAAIIMLLSIVGVLFYLAYGLFITRWFDYGALALADGISADLFAGSPSLLGQLPKSWIGGVAGILPVFGGEYFLQYLTIILAGIVGLISILGITGKKGKLGFIFILLADAVWCVLRLWSMHGGVPYFFEMDSMAKIIADYGKYIEYGIYGLLLLGGVSIVISFASGSSEFEMTIGSAILPIIYMAILVAGYVALLVLPGMMKFTISATVMRYILFGVWGLTLLLTIVGVHSSTLSRGVNGYLSCAVLLAITLMFATNVVISYVAKETDVSALVTIFTAIVPGLALMPLASFAAADLRN